MSSISNDDLRNAADAVEQAILMAYKYNRLIDLLADLSNDTFMAVCRDGFNGGHVVATAELEAEIAKRTK